MCETCGCGEDNGTVSIRLPGEKDENHHNHDHEHSHSHDHVHDHGHSHRINLGTDILSTNNLIAERNRGYLDALDILAINLMSSPGSGKTTLLERTISELSSEIEFYVIEGDQQTMNDANRIKQTGAHAVQVNTGNGCHLDAEMVNGAFKRLPPSKGSLLMIENVGNLVCPSLFDLGEKYRVVIMSVTEGEDKPVKYPTIFKSADLCLVNKVDLLPYLKFDMTRAIEYARKVNHHMKILEVSAITGEGLENWYEWLRKAAGKES